MASRLELQKILEDTIESTNVYYQPPGSEDSYMQHPAIVYNRSDIRNNYAGDIIYKQDTAYTITVIDEDPDSELVYKVSQLQHCRFNRHFTSDGLNHDVFTIYF